MKRKEILPSWIRFFAWIFLIFCITPIICIGSILTKSEFEIAAFGIKVTESHSQLPEAIYLSSLMFLSSVVAYAILWGRNWAVDLGVAYGAIALATSIYANIKGIMMMYSGGFNISLDPLLLIPFVLILYSKRKEWRAFPIREPHNNSNQCEPGEIVNASSAAGLPENHLHD